MSLEDYTIIKRIGEGGAGLTYLVKNSSGVERCMKEFRFGMKRGEEDTFKARELFEREARTLRGLNHPQIPHYLDFFVDDNNGEEKLYIIMEYVPGDDLEKLAQKQKFNEQDVVGVAKKVTNVLEYLHSFSPSIIHRDVKPKNLIQTPDKTIKLVDFGSVADKIMQETRSTFTRVGTFGFAAPELYYGEPTPASDVYSLGVTLVWLLSGGADPAELMNSKHRIDFKGKLNVSKRVENLLWDMTEPDLDKRISDTEELRQRLYGNETFAVALRSTDVVTVEYEPIKGGYAKFWHKRWSLQETVDKIQSVIGAVQSVCHDYGREIEVTSPLHIKAKKGSQKISAGCVEELVKSLPTIKEQKSGIVLVTYGVGTADGRVALDFTFQNEGYNYERGGYRKAGLLVNLSVNGFTAHNRKEHDELRASLGKLRSVNSFDNNEYDLF